jgi:predicted aspartyl protease
MRGRVDGDGREAILPLTVIGRSGVRAEVEATVDTGFTGSLCLPPDVVRSLSVPFVGRGVAVLASREVTVRIEAIRCDLRLEDVYAKV